MIQILQYDIYETYVAFKESFKLSENSFLMIFADSKNLHCQMDNIEALLCISLSSELVLLLQYARLKLDHDLISSNSNNTIPFLTAKVVDDMSSNPC